LEFGACESVQNEKNCQGCIRDEASYRVMLWSWFKNEPFGEAWDSPDRSRPRELNARPRRPCVF